MSRLIYSFLKHGIFKDIFKDNNLYIKYYELINFSFRRWIFLWYKKHIYSIKIVSIKFTYTNVLKVSFVTSVHS